jgi:outer membrane receptor protein involved in Fe transport
MGVSLDPAGAAVWLLLTSMGWGASSAQPQDPAPPPQVSAPYEETVIVTATGLPERLGESVTYASVLDERALARSPSLTLDDTLRQVPGFSLFRRSSSLVAHPTTQGVSLRGIGPSGTSRTLVLLDGLPINDPFGGWVQWNRLPPLALRSVEIVRGATSPLHGSSALSGTIHLLTRDIPRDTFALDLQGGTLGTWDVGGMASDRAGSWNYLVAGRAFNTEGYYLVDAQDRGAVDTRARSKHQSLFGRMTRGTLQLSVNLFHERRNNGTQLQTNATRLGTLDIGQRRGQVSWQVYGAAQRFDSTFSRILPNRSAEFLTAEQRIPAQALGGAFTVNPRGRLIVGVDARHVRGEDRRQSLAGAFVQDLVTVHPRIDLLGGVRIDLWQNRSNEVAVTPRAGVLVRAGRATLRSSAYRGFRAPTLNELYRPFRVGNVSTLANPDLDAETLWGLEGGADVSLATRLWLRTNAFWNRLDDAVGNVTISTSPQLIVRQRQNIGRARIRGAEVELVARLGRADRAIELRAAYLYSDAVDETSGRRLPQVPRHQGHLGVSLEGPVDVEVSTRLVGDQFEDDLNRLLLERFATVDLRVSRRLRRGLEAFVAVENLFDARFAVGRTPIETLGTPRLVHGGIRVTLGR